MHSRFIYCLTGQANFSGESSLYAFSRQSESSLVTLSTTSSLFSTSTLDIFNSHSSFEIVTMRGDDSSKTVKRFLRDSQGKAGSDKKSKEEKDESTPAFTSRSGSKRDRRPAAGVPTHVPGLLPGEEALLAEANILLSYEADLTSAERGVLAVTNFRLILAPEVRLIAPPCHLASLLTPRDTHDTHGTHDARHTT
jgi:hypothetical protein